MAGGEGKWEFRATEDDAWYSVTFAVVRNWLRLKYVGFNDDEDEHFLSTDFKSLQDLHDFQKRFRPCSVQLQDVDCQRIVEGLLVCASRLFIEDNSIRYYDAYIEDVQYMEHNFSGGEEECLCNFTLFWQHGPLAGDKINCSVADICLIQPVIEMDPTLASFFLTTKEIITASLNVGSAPCLDTSPVHNHTNSTTKKRAFTPVYAPKAKETVKAKSTGSKGNVRGWIERDQSELSLECIRDSDHINVIFIKNLDVHMSPSAIVEFVRDWVCVFPCVYIFPCLPWDTHTKGIITVESKVDFQTVYHFLNNPDHIIRSSCGRPWVISKEILKHKYLKNLINSLKEKYMDKNGEERCGGDVQIVKLGSKRYKESKRLKDMFVEYSDDVKRLKKKLAKEEGKILHPSNLG